MDISHKLNVSVVHAEQKVQFPWLQSAVRGCGYGSTSWRFNVMTAVAMMMNNDNDDVLSKQRYLNIYGSHGFSYYTYTCIHGVDHGIEASNFGPI